MKAIAFSGNAKKIPGTVDAYVRVYQEGDPSLRRELPDGRVIANPGMTLAEFRQLLGGDEGYLTDPAYRGEKHFVSVAAYKDADPQKTRVTFGFRFIPKKPIPEEFKGLVPPDRT